MPSTQLKTPTLVKLEAAKKEAKDALLASGKAKASPRRSARRVSANSTHMFNRRSKTNPGEVPAGTVNALEDAIDQQMLTYKGAMAQVEDMSENPLDWWREHEGSLSLLALLPEHNSGNMLDSHREFHRM